MFYCRKCADERGWPHETIIAKSRGPCELCHRTTVCAEVPCKDLPEPKKRCWLDDLTHMQRIAAYFAWQKGREECGYERSTMTITEWERMERDMAEEVGKRKCPWCGSGDTEKIEDEYQCCNCYGVWNDEGLVLSCPMCMHRTGQNWSLMHMANGMLRCEGCGTVFVVGQ